MLMDLDTPDPDPDPDPPSPAAVAHAFARLHSPDSRRNALLTLLPHLSAHEWRWLHSTTAARRFHCDLIARLPLELVAHVFSYLDVAAPFRLAPVSRCWNHVLRSLPLLTHSLRAWYADSQHLHAADYDFCHRKARLVHAFRHAAHPYRCFGVANLSSNICSFPILVQDTLIWCSNDDRVLNLLNMSTWSLRLLCGHARETIGSVCASTDIVAFFTTSSNCYVASLHVDAPLKKFRVANSAMFRATHCRKRTVACAGIVNDHAVVYIWDFDTQRGTSFNIGLQSYLFLHASLPDPSKPKLRLLLQPDKSTVVVFVIASRQDHPPEVRHSRYTYNGECLSESASLIHGLGLVSVQSPGIQQVTRVGHGPVFSLLLDAWDSDTFVHPSVFKLQFDEQLDKFTCPGQAIHQDGRLWVHGSYSWWNDTFYQSLSSLSHGKHPTPILGHVGTSDLSFHTPLLSNDLQSSDPHHGPVLVNDRFVVRSYNNGFYVMCFDDQSRAPRQNGQFFNLGSFRLLDTLPRN